MASQYAVGDLKEEFVKFLESSIEFYASLVEQLQPYLEGSLEDSSHNKRKVKIELLVLTFVNIDNTCVSVAMVFICISMPLIFM